MSGKYTGMQRILKNENSLVRWSFFDSSWPVSCGLLRRSSFIFCFVAGILLLQAFFSRAPGASAACERGKGRADQDGAAQLLLDALDDRYKYPRW